MEATLIYPHQLFKNHNAIKKDRTIFLIEESLILTEFPIHRQKLLLHRLSMKAFEKELIESGHEVTYLDALKHKTTQDVFEAIKSEGVVKMHIPDTTDRWLEKRISEFCKENSLEREWYESQLFLLDKEDAINRYESSKRFMARFYQKIRKDLDILMDGGDPIGGQWSFDEDNRKKLPKNYEPLDEMQTYSNEDIQLALNWLEEIEKSGVEVYGEKQFWLPYAREGAEEWLNDFFSERFELFGPYEDAISTEDARVYHSVISPLMNIGLLEPGEVINKAITFAEENDVPINSLEGFVRQIIGWREFIRASYESHGDEMRSKNFFDASHVLDKRWWTGETGINPVDLSIKRSLDYGYAHHIERLMVLGNVMLLSDIHPDEVYKWFMAMFVDAYDWVMVPNVYGMSQFADGGSFATKPYIAGANYIKKMSDFSKGEWEDTMTGLYWSFINKHIEVFKSNHRMSMMPRMWEKMDEEKQKSHIRHAQDFIG